MITKTISNRVNRSLRGGHFVLENVLRRLVDGLVLESNVLEYLSYDQMAAQMKTKRVKAW